MTRATTMTQDLSTLVLSEKPDDWIQDVHELTNPVIESTEFAYKVSSRSTIFEECSADDSVSQSTNLVQVNDEGVKIAARHVRIYTYISMLKICKVADFPHHYPQIHDKLLLESYSPRTWRTHPLHICSTEPYTPTDPLNKTVLNWIFLISALNFSFWSERDGQSDQYGVEWRDGWGSEERKVWTGYWSLVASLNRGNYFVIFTR